MFQGTTPIEVRLVIQDIMSRSGGKSAFCACSGNFTVDRMVSGMGIDVYSNDVSLYSKLISDAVTGKDTTDLKVTNEDLERVFASWEGHPLKKLCEVMFAMNVSRFAKRANEYQAEMYEAYTDERRSKNFYEKTRKRLSSGSLDFKIRDFYFGDFVEFLKAKKGAGVGLVFPPTYKGGYEKMFAFVENSFEYERAHYDVFNPKEADGIFLDILENDRNVIVCDVKRDALSDFLHAEVVLGEGKKSIYVYSSADSGKKYFVERAGKQLSSKYKIIPADYKFTEKTNIEVREVKVSDVNYFKAFFMGAKVNYTNGGDFALMFFADGLAWGFATFNSHLGAAGDSSVITGASDFVATSRTKRLSKLLVSLILTKDVRMLIAKKYYRLYSAILTMVFTDKPVSMKYRGVFELKKREKGKLFYIGNFNESTIKETYSLWLKKNKK